jgi:hypothetical protein
LVECIQANFEAPAVELRERIEEELAAFLGSVLPSDDRTLVVVKRGLEVETARQESDRFEVQPALSLG